MASAEPHEADEVEPGDVELRADGLDGADGAHGVDDAGSAEAEAEPVLEQRLSAFAVIRTTIKQQGLVVQVARPFGERVSAVGFERLLLEPAQVSFVRNDRLWLAAALAAGGLAATWPGLAGMPALAALLSTLLPLLGPGLLAAGVLVLLLAIADPRRVSVFLDREQALHPKILRGGADEPQAAAFVKAVRHAIIAYRCSGPPPEVVEEEAASADEAPPAGHSSLADAIDALLAMRQDGLLDEQEFSRFKEFAERR